MLSSELGEQIRGKKPSAYLPTYYPSVTDSSHSVPAEVAPGAFLRGLDIGLRNAVSYAVPGKLPPGDRSGIGPNFMVRLFSKNGETNAGIGPRRSNELFEFPTVHPCSYVLLGMGVDSEIVRYSYLSVDVDAE